MEIRTPSVAGMFYPANKNKLIAEIERYLSYSEKLHSFQDVYGLVAPHAGYVYSGKTAAYGYNLIKGRGYKTVVIVSPSHREYFPAISIYDGDAYETPLGVAHVDTELRNFFTADTQKIISSKRGHGQEHAVEVQIPFLQYMLPEFKILPIVMGDQNKMFIDALAAKLESVVGNDVLIVASSDLSHYHLQHEAEKLDMIVEDHINKFDYEGLRTDLSHNFCEACGGGAIVSMMKALAKKGIDKSLVLNRTDSSETSGDVSEVVGYLSAAFYE